MAITINGTGSITGLTAGGLPDGSIVADDLASSLDLTGKTVTLPSGTGGKILQVQQTFKRDTASQAFTTTSTYQDISGMSVDITPVAANSNILVSFSIHLMVGNGGTGHIRLARGSDDTIAIADAGLSNQLRDTAMFRPASTPYTLDQGSVNMTFLDDPTYTLGDTLTYKLRWTAGATYTTTFYLNRGSANNNNDYDPRTTSSITAMEVAA
jgi:hypothetical protein